MPLLWLQVRAMSAKYVMKCDDDTFVRVDAVMNEINKVPASKSFYLGNINYYHKPFRFGKWAVTYEVKSESIGSAILMGFFFLSFFCCFDFFR